MDGLGFLEEVRQARVRLNALYLEVDSKIADDIARSVEAAFEAIRKASEPVKLPEIKENKR